jgi:hypothetical protein
MMNVRKILDTARRFSSMGELMRKSGRDPGYGHVVGKQD